MMLAQGQMVYSSDRESRIIETILSGYKILILMRGASGSGKTTLARYIVENSIGRQSNDYGAKDFVFSTDDYFYDPTGRYNYRRELLETAHSFNQVRVTERLEQGWSPIIIDNTNCRIWEMMPYVRAAIRNGYLVEVLEPRTPWKKSAAKLSDKSRHGVSVSQVQSMLNRYEMTSAESLIKLSKCTYPAQMPQPRVYPPILPCGYQQPSFEAANPTPSPYTDGLPAGNNQADRASDEQYLQQKQLPTSGEDVGKLVVDFEKWNPVDEPTPKEQRQRVRSQQIATYSPQTQTPQTHSPIFSQAQVASMLKEYEPVQWADQPSTSRHQRKAKQPIAIAAKFDAATVVASSKSPSQPHVGSPSESTQQHNESLLSLLKNDEKTGEKDAINDTSNTSSNCCDDRTKQHLVRHSIYCANENKAFELLRQTYPRKDVSALWDLFVKCDGDANWAADILTKDDDDLDAGDATGNSDDADCDDDEPNAKDSFHCGCDWENQSDASDEDSAAQPQTQANLNLMNFRTLHQQSEPLPQLQPSPWQPQPQRSPRVGGRNGQRKAEARGQFKAKDELKKTIESKFVLPAREATHFKGFKSNSNTENSTNTNTNTNTNPNTSNTDQDEPLSECEIDTELDQDADEPSSDSELIQISLEPSTIKQLQGIFGSTIALTEELTVPTEPTAIFMPRVLAKDLYMLCVEAMYNQLEEERQKIVRKDEIFAKLLKNPNYQHYTESPSNAQELLDMEMAWNLAENNQQTTNNNDEIDDDIDNGNANQNQNDNANGNNNDDNDLDDDNQRAHYQNFKNNDNSSANLAFYITLLNLCESFPGIPRETLSDILIAHDNNYMETVQVLQSTMAAKPHGGRAVGKYLTQQELQEEDMCVKQLISYISGDNNGGHIANSGGGGSQTTKPTIVVKSPLSPDEAKRIALRDFEEARNMSVHHCQLKAECYQKAKNAIQSGNSAVAFYYSEIANFHKNKIDMFNHRAANRIMDVHRHSQNNPDLLDLHYLHTAEALTSLDLFVDRHITTLRALQRVYKHVFIITGRGLHSHGGISTIKNKVRARLSERGLRWHEVNPGLLKVKIFSASRVGQET